MIIGLTASTTGPISWNAVVTIVPNILINPCAIGDLLFILSSKLFTKFTTGSSESINAVKSIFCNSVLPALTIAFGAFPIIVAA